MAKITLDLFTMTTGTSNVSFSVHTLVGIGTEHYQQINGFKMTNISESFHMGRPQVKIASVIVFISMTVSDEVARRII